MYAATAGSDGTYSVSQKRPPPPKTVCNRPIFTQAEDISVIFCVFVANLYPRIFTNFGLFILIFSKMSLIFLSTYRFYHLKFPVPTNQIAVT